jgi:hypothetical protein
MDVDWVMFACVELIGLACLVHLWARRDRHHLMARLLWSAALPFPIVGPLFYWAFYDAPEPHCQADRTADPPRYDPHDLS